MNWKLAIMEADKILDEIFKMSGYRGDDVHKRFEQVTPEVLPDIEQLREAHKIRDRIVQEPDFIVNKEDAMAIIAVYKKAFGKLGLLEGCDE